MLLLLRGRDKAAAAEEEEAFEGGPSRARHRVGRNSGPFNRTISSTCWCCLQVCRTSPFNRTISSTCWCCLQKHAKSISRMGRRYQMVCGNRYWKAWRLFKRTWERSLVTLLCHFFYLFVPVLLGYSRKGTIQFFMKEYDKALEMYQEGLKHESRNQELLDGAGRCVEQINKASCGDLSPKELKEREVKAIQDPEIQSILTDPVMSQVLIDFDENPKAALEHAKNPVVMNKKCQVPCLFL